MTTNSDLLAPLRRYWGYDAFRPLQEPIVRSLLGRHDTCVVMPTGGGKSLCYQLPAAMLPDKTVIVVSPLIALMQDQVAQLAQMGIPSALLNSSLAAGEQREVIRKACSGAFRLLYLSPERLARQDTLEWLQQIPVSFFAIDEAHCISEWGHEFRPEYRLLNSLRVNFPGHPIAAFTASATQRVRHDIIQQLQLRDPRKYIASFHRRNLRYVVSPCDGRSQQDLLARAIRSYKDGNIIVYAPTIAKVGETVRFLESSEIPSVPYHSKLDASERNRSQERWMSDEVRVIVATVAFGLGINKAAVRAVIHLSLPKSIEQYYQEAGRAGRDGLAADCVLLWQKRDAGLLAHFTQQISDAEEKARAWERYHEIRDFVDSKTCRHLLICKHFGETPKWTTCDACDVCGSMPDWLAEPRMAARSKEPRLGLLKKVQGSAIGEINPDLREHLRQWRQETAKQQEIPAFVIMHDTTLDEICRIRPRSNSELLMVSGIGERKAATYGDKILELLARFEGNSQSPGERFLNSAPALETLNLLAKGRTIDEIARIRGCQRSTVVSMVSDLIERGQVEFHKGWVDKVKREKIERACATEGLERLRPVKDALPVEFTFDEIRLVVAHVRRQRQMASERKSSRRKSD